MAANINSNLANWSTTAASNQPDTTDSNTIVEDFQQLQAVVRKYLATADTIASGATTDLSTVGGPVNVITHSTGTTAITAFGTLSAGMWRFVRFSVSGGTLTITHNASSMKLPGSANISIADGDCALVETLGSGNWKMHAYWAASGAPVGTVPIANGGTGATSASAARTALGLAIGTDVQAYDATLTAFAGGLTAANKIPYATALDTLGELDYSTDGTFAANSDTKIPSEKAVKTYVTANGGLAAANQTQMEAASSNAVAVTPGTQIFHPGAIKAWAVFDGTASGTITPATSFGIHGTNKISKTATGRYRVNFATAFSTANYGLFGAVSYGSANNRMVNPDGQNFASPLTTGYAEIAVVDGSNNYTDCPIVFVAFVGDV